MVQDPHLGIPFGMDWSRLVIFRASPIDLDNELKRHGIWTYDDLFSRHNDVVAALQAVYKIDAVALVRAARWLQKQDDGG
jgi:hypothetical protein